MDGAARLLVVEDDTNAREALVELLRCEGYIAAGAADGQTALARLCTHIVDAVVVDLGLPDIDGVDVIRAARELPNRPAVIVFTGHYRYKRAAEAAGCDAFVLKPDVEKLLERVRALVEADPAMAQIPMVAFSANVDQVPGAVATIRKAVDRT